MTEPTKRGPGRPRKVIEPELEPTTEAQPEVQPEPVPPGPLVLEVRLGPPGQGKIIFSQRVYAHTINQSNPTQAVITGALHPLKSDV